MAFTRKYRVDCGLIDKNGNTGRLKDGEVTVGGFDGEEVAQRLVQDDLAKQGLTATDIHTTRIR